MFLYVVKECAIGCKQQSHFIKLINPTSVQPCAATHQIILLNDCSFLLLSLIHKALKVAKINNENEHSEAPAELPTNNAIRCPSALIQKLRLSQWESLDQSCNQDNRNMNDSLFIVGGNP